MSSGDSVRHSGEVVPFVRGKPAVAHSVATKIRCYELWSTVAARNAAHVERLFGREMAGTDVPIPDRHTIQDWVRDEVWAQQADKEWRDTSNWTVEQMRAYMLANALLAEKNRHDIQLGLYAGREMEAAMLLKAGELSDRKQERAMPLESIKPPAETTTSDDKPRDEREADAKAAMIQRKTARSG